MGQQKLIWCSQPYEPGLLEMLRSAADPEELILAWSQNASNLAGVVRDERLLSDCHIAIGQPDPQDVIDSTSLEWVHLTSAGYTRYDTDAVRQAVRARGMIVTNSSQVYDEPCAQHALAMLLAMTRQLPRAVRDQATQAWHYNAIRRDSLVLARQTVAIVGMGTIGKRLAELLGPFGCKVIGFRRSVSGSESVPTHSIDQLDESLPNVDVVINTLPASSSTANFFDHDRFARFKPGSLYINIGRGDTNDQRALAFALTQGQIAQAYLDVTTPEPLPADHVLWTTPNCHITPHTAGGWADEFARQLEHFIDNLRLFRSGQPLLGRILDR